jgi:hypothetical protein
MIAPQIGQRELGKLSLLRAIDSLSRAAGAMRNACFHFNENHGSAVDRHDIQLAAEDSITAMEDLISSPFEKLRRRALAAPAERLLWEEPRLKVENGVAK